MNYFEIVGIDPDAPWDQAHFESLLQTKQDEWSTQSTGVGRRALQAKQYLDLLSEIQAILSNPAKRLAHLDSVRQEQLAERKKQLKKDIDWYNAQKTATDHEIAQFLRAYEDVATRDEIMKQLNITIHRSSSEAIKVPSRIETSTLNEIDDLLNVLDKTSLYDLLCLPQTAEAKDLCVAARGLHKKAVQNRSDTSKKTLAKHAETIFSSPEKRVQYDALLRQKRLDSLCTDLDSRMERKTDPVLPKPGIELFLKKAGDAGCSRREAFNQLLKYAAQKGWTLLPDSVDKGEQQEHIEEQLKEMIGKKFYCSARDLLHKYEDMFNRNEMQERYRTIQATINSAERKFAQTKTIFSSREEKIAYCRTALRICADYQETQVALRKLLVAPRSFQAYVDEASIVPSWELPMPDMQCKLIRKYFSPPESEIDGLVLMTSGEQFIDTTVETGLPVYYAAFTVCEDVVSSSSALLREPLLVTAEVTDIQIWTTNGYIELIWSAPANVHNLIIRRKEGIAPQSIQDGTTIIPQNMDSLVDQRVQNNITYYYHIACQFKNDKGLIETTPGVIITVVAGVPPDRNESVEEITDFTYQQQGILLFLRWQWPTNCQAVNISYEKKYDTHAHNKAIKKRVTREEYEYLGYYQIECTPGQEYVVIIATIYEQANRYVLSDGVEQTIYVEDPINVDYEIKKTFYSQERYLILRTSVPIDLPPFRLVCYRHRSPLTKQEGELVYRSDQTISLNGILHIPLGPRTYPPDTFAKLFLEDEHTAYSVRFRLLNRKKSRLG